LLNVFTVNRFLRQKLAFSAAENIVFSAGKYYFLLEKTPFSPQENALSSISYFAISDGRSTIYHLSTTTSPARINTGVSEDWW
jgi:hypothetical protein